MTGWTRLTTEVLHRGPFITLNRDSVIKPDGALGTYEHITVDDAVRVVAIDERDQVALVDFYLQNKRVLHPPGGGIGGQEPREAARRELEEETGLIAGELHLLP
jgi:8-oxo-dGTP pyrophosphatase MutT (NUDIX family)